MAWQVLYLLTGSTLPAEALDPHWWAMHEPAGNPDAQLLDRIELLLQQPVLQHRLHIMDITRRSAQPSSSEPKPGHLDEGLWTGIGATSSSYFHGMLALPKTSSGGIPEWLAHDFGTIHALSHLSAWAGGISQWGRRANLRQIRTCFKDSRSPRSTLLSPALPYVGAQCVSAIATRLQSLRACISFSVSFLHQWTLWTFNAAIIASVHPLRRHSFSKLCQGSQVSFAAASSSHVMRTPTPVHWMAGSGDSRQEHGQAILESIPPVWR
jgi:hypothetical protein